MAFTPLNLVKPTPSFQPLGATVQPIKPQSTGIIGSVVDYVKNIPSQIKSAATSSFQQGIQGATQVQQGGGPMGGAVAGLEGALKVGAGVAGVVFSPIAPVTDIIGKAIQFAGYKLAETPLIKDYAKTATETDTRVLEALQNLGGIAMGILGAKAGDIKLKDIPVEKLNEIAQNPEIIPAVEKVMKAQKVAEAKPTPSFQPIEIKPTEAPVSPQNAPTAPITPKVDISSSLAQEVQKYSSAEEFANAQSNKGQVVFRAQTGESGGGLKTSEYGKGTYFFGDYPRAKEFTQGRSGADVVVAEPLKNPLVLDMQKQGVSGIKQEAIDAGLGGTPLKTRLSDAIDFLRDKGNYDGVRIVHGDINGTPMSYEIYKTKPQTTSLIDFYNKNKVKPAEVKTEPIAGAPKPIETVSNEQASRVFERIQKENPQIEGQVGYDPIKLKEDAQKAVDLVAKDKQQAYRIAMGAETSPEVTSTAVNIAMTEKALADGNNVLAARLIKNRSLEQTRRGQEIVAERGSVTDNSTSKYVKELVAARLDALGKNYLDNMKIGKRVADKTKALARIDKEVAKVEAQIKGKKLDVKTALGLLDKLACV